MATEKRLIDANELKDKFLYLRKMWSETEIVLTINDAKTVDAVEVVHGRWVWHDGCFHCTNCKATEDNITKYCPDCGAKMDGGANNA